MPETIPAWPLKDKMLHVGAYALLGFLILRGFKHSRWHRHRALIMWASIILTGLYGLSDEWHQYHVPFRSAEVGDVVADLAGGLCGVFLYDWLEKQWPIVRCL
jgi:VanZ family protein